MKKITFILFVAISVIACKKENDTENPVISISSPTEGQMFSNGDSASVEFSVTDADMHGFDFAIVNTATNDTLFTADEHPHGNVTFNQKYKLPNVSTQMKITINGEDHNGNTSTKSVNFHCM